MDNTNDEKKFFDIVPPGKTSPSQTSRPIINNQATGGDPMVMDKPSVAPEKSEEAQPQAADVSPEYDNISTLVEQSNPETIAEEKTELEHEEETAKVGNPGPAPNHNEAPQTQTAVEQSHQTEELHPANEEPLLPEHATPAEVNHPVVVHHAKSKHPIRLALQVIVIVVFAIIIVGDILLDAGIVKSNPSLPHTHFLHSAQSSY